MTTAWRPLVVLLMCGTALSACVSTRHLPAAPVATAPAPPPARPMPPLLTSPTPHPIVMSEGDAVVESALALVGTAYRFGGATPEAGFDCSGLVVYVMAQQDIAMPRTVQEQYRVGLPVARTELQAGDLVFFTTTGPGATHVGIVSNAERREFVHAPNSMSAVRIDRLDAEYWHRNWIGARRVY